MRKDLNSVFLVVSHNVEPHERHPFEGKPGEQALAVVGNLNMGCKSRILKRRWIITITLAITRNIPQRRFS